MKRPYILNLIIVLLLIVLIVILNRNYFDVFLNKAIINKSKVIIIDAGHGGIDGGGVGTTGTIEKNINLAISQKLKGYLEGSGYTCVMVRETDEGLYSPIGTIRNKKNEDLKNRKQLIKDYKGDIFISIHLNKFSLSQYFGAQVFYNKGDEVSHKLATAVQESLIKVMNRGNTRVEKPANGYVLIRDNNIPSIIVECGFLSNHTEEQLLQDDNYQNKLAWAIYCGIIKYLSEQ